AQRLKHDYIGTEHMLVGLVSVESDAGAVILKQRNIDLERVREEVERMVETGVKEPSFGQLPFTLRAKKVFEFSMEAADGLGHRILGTDHLLLGLIREREGIAAQVLRTLGVDLEEVRGAAKGSGSDDPADRLRSYFGFLLAQARAFGRDKIGSE